MEQVDLTIKVPVELILKEFECPICLEFLEQTCITPCGHLFCRGCIDDCLNRRHECPHCKVECTFDQVVRNYHSDTVLKILLEEKDKASKEYYDKLFELALARQESASRNPVQTVFQENMKSSLFAFQTYYQDLKAKTERQIVRMKQNGEEAKIRRLEEQLEVTVNLLVEAYDKHMKELAPAPELLPVRAFIKIPSKGVIIDAHLPRLHTIKDLEQIIFDYFTVRNDPVQQLGPGRFILQQAIAGQEEVEIVLSDDPMVPICNYKIVQGSSLIYDGPISLRSDAPKYCFTYYYEKGAGMSVDYYACAHCKMNWICEACAVECHASHDVKIAIRNHTPNWGCCYCVKRGICTIPNIKTKK